MRRVRAEGEVGRCDYVAAGKGGGGGALLRRSRQIGMRGPKVKVPVRVWVMEGGGSS